MKIKLLVMDVDGTLTDGRIYVGSEGELMKAFHVRDGYAIAHILPKYQIIPCIITGRASKIVEIRAKELKITQLHQNIQDKLSKLAEIASFYGVSAQEIAYIGDDLNDLDCIRFCGLSACPNDACTEVKANVDYVCVHGGGDGAVREFIEWMIAKEQKETEA